MSFIHTTHRTFGAMLLVAGCCIGAGMLGLPLFTACAGFIPSTVGFLVSWVFMLSTGLLLLEANLWFGQGVNLMTLAEKTLGKRAKELVALLFSFLFFCLLVAYLLAGGELVIGYVNPFLHDPMTAFQGAFLLTVLFALAIFFGLESVDLVNRALMAGLLLSYLALLFFGIPKVSFENLLSYDSGLILPAIPAMIISFGYHNLIPSLTDYLEGDAKQIRRAIIGGSLIALAVYLVWDGVILGMLASKECLRGGEDEGAMISKLFEEITTDRRVPLFLNAFSFFAIWTSFLAVAVSFVDFLADGLHVKKTVVGRMSLIAFVLLPPLVIAAIYPTIFLKALSYAGAFGAVILFGAIPALMVWHGRYIEGRVGKRLLPFGKKALILVLLFSLFVFFMQLKNELGM